MTWETKVLEWAQSKIYLDTLHVGSFSDEKSPHEFNLKFTMMLECIFPCIM